MKKRCLFIFLVLFLTLRHTPLGLAFSRFIGGDFAEMARAAHATGERSAITFFVLAVFSICLYLVLFRLQELQGYVSRFKIHRRKSLILTVVFIYLSLLLGIGKYPLLTDENRDFWVFKAIRTHGIGAYINGEGPRDERIAGLLYWTRRAHMPLHYLFAASAASFFNMPHHIAYYRFLFASFYCMWLLAVVLFCSGLKVSTNFPYFLCVIPFAFTSLRDNTLIRCGTEFFAFLGITTFMLILFLIYKQHIEFKPFQAALLFISLLVATLAKVTAIFASVCLLFALAITVGINKVNPVRKSDIFDNKAHFFSKALILSLCLTIAAIGAYILLFNGTPVYKLQVKTYLGLLIEALPFTKGMNHLYFENNFVGQLIPAKKDFFITGIFRYSPILIMGFIYAIHGLYRRLKVTGKVCLFDFLIFMWVVLGVSGILYIVPIARYTSPFTFGLAYLIFRGFELTDSASPGKMYILTCLLTGATEVFLGSFA